MPVWDLISNSLPPLHMWLIHITVVGCHLVVNPVWFKAGQEQLTLPYFLTSLENLSTYSKKLCVILLAYTYVHMYNAMPRGIGAPLLPTPRLFMVDTPDSVLHSPH